MSIYCTLVFGEGKKKNNKTPPARHQYVPVHRESSILPVEEKPKNPTKQTQKLTKKPEKTNPSRTQQAGE